MAKEEQRGGTSSTSRAERDAKARAIPELMRRAMALGLSGFFTTEEALRKALGDNLPQDWVDFAADQSDRTRKDFADAVAGEIGKVLEKVDFAELLGELLQTHPVEVRATVRLLPADEDGVRRPSLGNMRVRLDVDPESDDSDDR